MAAKGTSQHAFLEVCAGDRQQHEAEAAEYARLSDFVRAKHAQLGLAGADLAALDDEGRELAKELYEADPSAAAQGACRTGAPAPLALGRLVIELDAGAAPKAVANFVALCEGGKVGKASGKPLHYAGVPVHRAQKGFVLQGGDVVKGDGSAGDSIYGGKFNDDKKALTKKHQTVGVVGMANKGKNTNTSQFYVTLAPALKQCDGKHVVIGQVVNDEGLAMLGKINTDIATEGGSPKVPLFVGACGLLPRNA